MTTREILSIPSFEHDLRELVKLARSVDMNGDRRKIQELTFEIEHRTQTMLRRYRNLFIEWEVRSNGR
jgi:hypothetical protein